MQDTEDRPSSHAACNDPVEFTAHRFFMLRS